MARLVKRKAGPKLTSLAPVKAAEKLAEFWLWLRVLGPEAVVEVRLLTLAVVRWLVLSRARYCQSSRILFAGSEILLKRPGLFVPSVSILCWARKVTPALWALNRPPGPGFEGNCEKIRQTKSF